MRGEGSKEQEAWLKWGIRGEKIERKHEKNFDEQIQIPGNKVKLVRKGDSAIWLGVAGKPQKMTEITYKIDLSKDVQMEIT